MQLVDTHCHLNFQRYDHDRADVLRRAADAGVQRIIVPAIDLPSCREAIALAEREQSIYAAVGIHPNSSADFTENMRDELRNLARSPQVVAIGEIGLDYHWDKSPKPAQWRAFEAQLALASELELPVIIHNREGRVDTVPPGRAATQGLARPAARPGHRLAAPAAPRPNPKAENQRRGRNLQRGRHRSTDGRCPGPAVAALLRARRSIARSRKRRPPWSSA